MYTHVCGMQELYSLELQVNYVVRIQPLIIVIVAHINATEDSSAVNALPCSVCAPASIVYSCLTVLVQ